MIFKVFATLLVATVAISGFVKADTLPQPFNNQYENANRNFKTETAMWADYIHYKGDKFCHEWRSAANSTVKASGITFKEVGCKIVDYRHKVAVVYATIAHHHGHRFSYTGPIGYSIEGTTWVIPKKDHYDFEGGLCHKVIYFWCLDDQVRRVPVDLDG